MLRSGNTCYYFIAGNLPIFLWVSIAALISLPAVSPFPAGAQTSLQGAIVIEEGGQLWLEGSTTVTGYTCRAKRLSGNGSIENTGDPLENIKGRAGVSVSVSIPVYSFDCGKKAMNRDMYEALKAEQHPYIRYKLLDAALADSAASPTGQKEDWMPIKTTGVLEIAGVQDTTSLFVQGKLSSKRRFRVRGSKQLNMKRFDIEPPTALLGLIKAKSKLTVHFDVTVQLKN